MDADALADTALADNATAESPGSNSDRTGVIAADSLEAEDMAATEVMAKQEDPAGQNPDDLEGTKPIGRYASRLINRFQKSPLLITILYIVIL